MSFGAPELLLDAEATVENVEPVGVQTAARSPLQLFWRRFRTDRVALVSGAFIFLLIVAAAAAPIVVSVLGVPGPDVQDPAALSIFGGATGPTGRHPFGVDELGRDVLARVIYGARVSLEVGVVGTSLAAVVGTVVGLLAGFYGRWVDMLLMRVDVFLAFPVLVLGLGIGAACGVRGCLSGVIEPGIGTVIFIVALSSFTYVARIVRGQVLSLREAEFVESARSLGASNLRILFAEILPNLITPLIVYSSLLLPQAILLEATLSFLGVGVRAPTASWGQMISDATPDFTTAWWYMVFPGAALLLTVLAFNLAGDGLRDALNPKEQRSR
jgi:ABC-type dipeptide/oligopeptide/nickel transport system permease subunit